MINKTAQQQLSSVISVLQVYTGKLSLVDLAGSERASETNNVGRQLKDGANINRCESDELSCSFLPLFGIRGAAQHSMLALYRSFI